MIIDFDRDDFHWNQTSTASGAAYFIWPKKINVEDFDHIREVLILQLKTIERMALANQQKLEQAQPEES